MTTAPVTAVVVTADPRRDHLAMTIRSLAKQENPPAEVLFVDGTSGGHALDKGGDCSLCGNVVSEAITELENQGATVRNIHDEKAGIGEARRIGMEEATEPVVWHLDEDANILSEDWTQKALSELDKPEVAGVGGNVTPIEDSRVGKFFGATDAVTGAVPGGWYIMYPRRLCMGDGECLLVGQQRGEDITVRRTLNESGDLVRRPDLLAQKDLPTTRQKKARNIVLSAAGGAVAGTLADKLFSAVLGDV